MTKNRSKFKPAPRKPAQKNKSSLRRRSLPASRTASTRSDTKRARIIAMLRTAGGATIAAMMIATDWQQHSVRGFLAAVVRRKLGLDLVSEPTDQGRSIVSGMARLLPLLIVQGRRRDVMQAVRRTGRASTNTSIGDEIAHLRALDLKGLRGRWQSVFQRSAPAHLPRHLLFAILAYRIQADRFGDLDYATRQFLDQTEAAEPGSAICARLVSFDQKRTELTAGTVLIREWDRKEHRVMVMASGFAWNGQSFDSLFKVAFAITGTKWNGPRFFGLRAKEDQAAREAPLNIS